MIKRFIRNIRQKPKGTRDQIALVLAGSFTGLVFVIWAYHMPSKMSALSEYKEDDSEPAFSQLFGEIGDQLSAIKESVPDEVSLEEELETDRSEIDINYDSDGQDYGFATDSSVQSDPIDAANQDMTPTIRLVTTSSTASSSGSDTE